MVQFGAVLVQLLGQCWCSVGVWFSCGAVFVQFLVFGAVLVEFCSSVGAVVV